MVNGWQLWCKNEGVEKMTPELSVSFEKAAPALWATGSGPIAVDASMAATDSNG